MNRAFARVAGVVLIAIGLNGCSGMGSMGSATSLYQQLGGMDTVSKLAGNMVTSSMTDPRLAGLLGKVNPSTATPKVADQMCAALGGGCKPAFTDQQMAAAASRLTPEQKTAVSENFSSSLNSVTSNSVLREAVTKSLGSKMGGILAVL
jgi:truncated hemoglobin YjbI